MPVAFPAAGAGSGRYDGAVGAARRSVRSVAGNRGPGYFCAEAGAGHRSELLQMGIEGWTVLKEGLCRFVVYFGGKVAESAGFTIFFVSLLVVDKG